MPTSNSKPSLLVILINLFWFLGLILGLVTASLGMLVKQWLREYLSNDSTSPQARARIRYSRHLSLERWYVFTIASSLPSLLQAAVAFFLIALCLFVWRLNYPLFRCITTASALWFAFYGFVLVAPIFSSRCPYKSPSLKTTTQSLRLSVHRILRGLLQLHSIWGKSLAFLDPGPLLEETDLRVSSKQDDAIWSDADKLFFDDRLVKDTIYMCLADVDGPSTVNCVQEITKRRELKTEPSNLIHYGQDSVGVALVNAFMRELDSQIHKTESIQWENWMGEAYILLLDNWQYCSEKIGKPQLVDLLLAVIMQDWQISEHILRWKPQVSFSVMSFAFDHPRSGRSCTFDFLIYY